MINIIKTSNVKILKSSAMLKSGVPDLLGPSLFDLKRIRIINFKLWSSSF